MLDTKNIVKTYCVEKSDFLTFVDITLWNQSPWPAHIHRLIYVFHQLCVDNLEGGLFL